MTDSKADFIDNVKKIKVQSSTDADCDNPIFNALYTALNLIDLKPKSFMYVITQATPKDYNFFEPILQLLSRKRVQVSCLTDSILIPFTYLFFCCR